MMEGSLNVDTFDKSLIFSISFARKFVSPNIHPQVFAHKLVHRKGWETCRPKSYNLSLDSSTRAFQNGG